MRILFCYAVIMVIVVATLFLIGSVVWHEWTKIRAFVIACSVCSGSGSAAGTGGFKQEECPHCGGSGAEPEQDESDEQGEDDTAAWDRGHDHDTDYRAGVSL